MLRHPTLSVVTFFVSLAFASGANAGILFEHDFQGGQAPVSTVRMDGISSMKLWDNFMLTSHSEITQIEAKLYFTNMVQQIGTPVPSVNFEIWDSELENIIYSASIGEGHLFHNTQDWIASASFNDLTLESGNYYLSIYHLSPEGTGMMSWVNAAAIDDGSRWASQKYMPLPSKSYFRNHDLAFRIIGNDKTIEVPEPIAASMFAIGLLGLAGFRKLQSALSNHRAA